MTSSADRVNRPPRARQSRPKTWRIAGVVALTLWLAPAARASDAEFCSASAVASVTTKDGADGTTLVPITLNGMATEATLDTGAPVGVMRESTADQLGLKRWPIPLNAVSGVSGRPFEEGTLVETLGIGGATIRTVAFLISPRSHADDAGSIGLIGADVFARYDLFLDFGNRHIAFYTPGSCQPNHAGAMPLTVAASHHVYVDLELDGERVHALIDSGASRSVMTLGTAHRLFGLDETSPGVRRIGRMQGADGGSVDAYAYGFGKLASGDIELAAPGILLVPDETRRVHRVITPGQSEAEGLPDLVLGMPELRRLQLLVGYVSKRLFVQARPEAQ